jgi:rhamnosyltransferase
MILGSAESMKRLVILAHYDPHGEVASHVRRQLTALQGIADEVVVSTTASLTDEARSYLSARSTLIERVNLGQDFFGWKEALIESRYREFDEVILTNDSYIGYARPLERIVSEMSFRDSDFWGLTRSDRHTPHLQSYFLSFSPAVVHSEAFRQFWLRFDPPVDRWAAISTGELRITGYLEDAGHSWDSYFHSTPADQASIRRRTIWWAKRRAALKPPEERRAAYERFAVESESPYVASADAFLDDGRLPILKLDVLRFDPYWLGSDELLTKAERRWPELMDGVRDFLERTKPFYPGRRNENSGSHRLSLVHRTRFGY